MGEVYLAEDTRLRRKVALKMLSAELTKDEHRVRRFEKEARAASALNHPNIVTIHDIGETEVGRFIVMEAIEGRTLRALAKEPLSLESLAQLGAQIAKALAVAHNAGIVHRDIKPENIMVRDDGYVKVLDFGLVRLIPRDAAEPQAETQTLVGGPQALPAQGRSSTDAGALLGTTAYMSPEQARGEAVSSATDMFSLGIVLYELGTGQHPFKADSRIGVLSAIISQSPVSPSRLIPEIPAALEALILQLLEKDPRLRPGASEAERILTRLAQSTAVGASRRAGTVPVPDRPPVPAKKPHHVGREKERGKLRADFDSTVGGQGRMLCVTGEPGIGKTTLVEDFLSELTAGDQPCRIARGRCSERLAGTEAYLPFLEALDSLLHGENGESVVRAMKLLAPTWYVQIIPLSAGDSSTERMLTDAKVASQERMKRELAAFLAEVSKLRPVIISFDDLHWADVATVDLIAYLVTRFESMRLLIIVTFRPSDLLLAKHPFGEVKLDLQGRGVCHEIPLEFLSREEIKRYLALEFPENQFPAEFPALIYAKTEGSPLFMVDLVRYLRDRKVIVQQKGRWELVQSVPDVEAELPESVRSMIQRKIDQLGDGDRRLLTAASVQGHEFDAAVVAAALEIDAADVEERLEALDRVHAFVRPVREHEFPDSTLTVRYSFVHALYQNALYAALRPTRRAALSAAVANALLGYHRDQTAEVASDLALLFETARNFEKASDFFLQAARNAARVYANEEAVELSRRAIANAEKLRGEARYTRLLAAALDLARLHQTLSRFEDARTDFELAEKVAHEANDAGAEISAVCGSAMALCNLRRLAEMRAQGDRALELARGTESTVGIASAEAVLATERMCSGELAAAEHLYDRAIPMLKKEGLSIDALEAVTYRGLLHTWRLEYQQAHQVLDWALAKAQELGTCFHLVANHFQRGMVLGNQGRMSEALSTLQEGRRLGELNGERYWIARMPNTIGWLYRELQDLETALALDTENVPLAREMDMAEAEANAHVNLGHDYLVLGEPERAVAHLQQAKRIYEQDVWYRWRYNIRFEAEMANYYIARGELSSAASHAAACLKSAEAALARKYIAWAHKLLGDIAALEDRVEQAQRELQLALQILANHPCPIIEWKILHALADLAGQMKDSDAADELLGRARSVITSLAESVHDEHLREQFLGSKSVRELET